MEEVDTYHHRDQKAALKHSLFSILLKNFLNVSIFYFIIYYLLYYLLFIYYCSHILK